MHISPVFKEENRWAHRVCLAFEPDTAFIRSRLANISPMMAFWCQQHWNSNQYVGQAQTKCGAVRLMDLALAVLKAIHLH